MATKFMVCGSRSITDKEKIFAQLESFWNTQLNSSSEIVVVEGGAKGVDTIAGEWATSKGFEIEVHKPDYKKYARGAPIRRNEEMVKISDIVLVLWDGVSKGTQNSIDLCQAYGKKYKIVKM